ncbi:MAG: hypothetical protein JSU73_08385 [candidate division WOR-3 bacterium]|nr:MAG: hypothetical protein JSU73_08385 [candidate division WOR-3 bacterium]
MKKMLIIAGFLYFAICTGQYLEKTIWLYDSFPRLGEPYVALHNPTTNRMYVAGWQDIQVYDAGLLQKHAFLGYQAEWVAASRCPNVNRIYFSADDGVLAVFDDRADTVVALHFNVTSRPWSLAYSATSQRLYVADWGNHWVVAVDARSGAVLDTVGLHGTADRLVWDSFRNRMLCTGQRWSERDPVQVVDCATHSVAEIPGTGRSTDVVLHPEGDRLYCLGVDSARTRNVIRMVDADSLVVYDSLVLPTSDDWGDDGRLILHPAAGRIYACWLDELTDGRGPWSRMQDTMVVIDLVSDTVVGLIGLPEGYWQHSFAINDSNPKLYLTSLVCESLVVIGPDDSIVATLPLVDEYKAIEWNSVDNTIYVPYCDTMWVIDCSTDSIIHKEDYRGFDVRALQWNRLGNKLYMFDYGTIAALDAGDTIAKRIPVWSHPWPLAYYPDLNKLYLHKSGKMAVFDCTSDSVVKALDFSLTLGGDGFIIPGMPKMYVPARYSTAIFDLTTDSLMAVGSWQRQNFIYNFNNSLVYAYRGGSVLAIDPSEDVTRAEIHLPANTRSADVDMGRNLLYCLLIHGFGPIYVVDCDSHVIVDSISLPPGTTYNGLVMLDEVDKLYVFGWGRTTVIDCASHEVVKNLERGRGLGIHDPRSGRFWLSDRDCVYVLDSSSDSVVAEFDAEINNLALDSVSGRVYGGREKALYVFRDTLTGVSEGRTDVLKKAGRIPATVIRGLLSLSGGVKADLLDISGRRVMELEPGHNDIRHVAPGVYFVREEGPRGQGSKGSARELAGCASRVRRVVIQK